MLWKLNKNNKKSKTKTENKKQKTKKKQKKKQPKKKAFVISIHNYGINLDTQQICCNTADLINSFCLC